MNILNGIDVENSLISLGVPHSQKQLEKAKKLTELFYNVITNPKNKGEFDNFFKILNLEEKEVLINFLDYNLDIFDSKGNEVYKSIENRLVLHIHNLLKDSWHILRQKSIIKILDKVRPRNIVDIGFGVPSAYVKEIILKQIFPINLTLGDYYDSAFKFAEVLLNIWNKNWKNYILFKKTNMNKEEYIGDYDLYIFQDSIEHALRPTIYLQKYIKSVRKKASFLFSLPIGPIFPRHNIAWSNNNEAISWLEEAGLCINHLEEIFINPEVDLFADRLGTSFHNLVILAQKKD